MKLFSTILSAFLALSPLAEGASVSNNTFDKVIQGKSTATTKEYRFNLNQGNANPGLRGNAATGKLEFSQDGALWKNVGSGGGGGSGILLNDNSGFEDGLGGWAASGGTFAITSTAANVAFGNNAASWTPSAIGQTLSYASIAVPSGLQGKTGTLSLYYKGGDAGYVYEVTDGTNAIATSPALVASTGYSAKKILTFTYPASNTIVIRLRTTTASPAAIFVDDFRVGQELITSPAVQGSQYVGSVSFPSCVFSRASGGGMGDYTATTGCTPTKSADASGEIAVPSTLLPGVDLKPDPAYIYRFEFKGAFGMGALATTSGQTWQIFDGTTSAPGGYQEVSTNTGAIYSRVSGIDGIYKPNVTGLRTVRLQTQVTSNNSANAAFDQLSINVYKYPRAALVDTAQGISIDQSGWKIDAAITGANIGMGNNSSFTPVAVAGLSLVAPADSAPVSLACLNADSTGTTCAGTSQAGISFTPPDARDTYEVCAAFQNVINSPANAAVYNTFALYETGNSNSTLGQGGTNKPASYWNLASAGAFGTTFNLCENFTFADTSRRTVRLNYTLDAGSNNATLIALAPRALNFKVRRKVANADVVRLELPKSAVSSSNTTTGLKVETIGFGPSCAVVAGSATPGIASTSGTSLQGSCTATFAANTFSSAPVCTCTAATGAGTDQWCMRSDQIPLTANSVTFATRFQNGSGQNVGHIAIQCIGPR